jgi:hypothetical protein
MLPTAFLEWWFAPWRYAVTAPAHASDGSDLIGRRDAYRLWCAHAGAVAPLPASFDAGWHTAASEDGGELTSCAGLFGGLLAARRHQQEALVQLPLADRKWCMSIASVQPLPECGRVDYAPGDTLEVRGLAELACHLERGFPGMWSRLKLLLPQPLQERVTSLLQQGRVASDVPEAATQRALRCWRLCRQRAGAR